MFHLVVAALRILVDVAVYRLARLEMANWVAAVSLLVALRVPPGEAAARAAWALGLNLLAYLANDFFDVEQDLATGRAPEKTRFLADHRRAAIGAQVALAVALVASAVAFEPELLVAFVLGGGLCVVYSRWGKRLPVVDVLSMAVWGGAMAAAGAPLTHAAALPLLGALALFSATFELIQVLRDRAEDVEANVRTTAVVLGEGPTRALARLTVVGAAVYVALSLSPWAALPVAAAVALLGGPPDRAWNRVRFALGVGWLVALGLTWSRAGGA
ncbi:MAG: UbiA family prenyltransferase [Polyangiaceae bacterium]|nr:UbiA family prenyltransferase [Polyangiaceae bacterium]